MRRGATMLTLRQRLLLGDDAKLLQAIKGKGTLVFHCTLSKEEFCIEMSPPFLSLDNGNLPTISLDAYRSNSRNSKVESSELFASVTMEEKKPFKFVQVLFDGIVAGGAAGGVVETILYPIDTIKTRLQAARGGSKIQLKGLYSGLAGNLAGVLPASAIFVGVYEPTKQKLLKMFPENLSAFAHLSAGAIAGVASSLIRVPTEVVKQRMQTGHFASAPDAVRLIVAKEGFKGLYAGYSSFLLRDLPFDAIQFCIYEQFQIGYKIAARRELNDPENAVIGAFAGYWTKGTMDRHRRFNFLWRPGEDKTASF